MRQTPRIKINTGAFISDAPYPIIEQVAPNYPLGIYIASMVRQHGIIPWDLYSLYGASARNYPLGFI
ncbi:hypothetical protein [Arthrospira platensis]|uniref:hypothetical protein n=1 Tax=Limnospira platensis TaxID=118562 RepID=UPI0009EDFE8B